MFGGAQKIGRGGGGGGRGGGGGKRNAYAMQNTSRTSNSGGGGGGRLSMSGSSISGRNPPASATAQSPAVDETFSLVARSPLSYAATLRLPPGLVEEIKRVEAQGGAAKIKFDCYPNNASGNVIDVGGKEFRFTWSREMNDLCDIYEEPQNNDGSNGLLVESGCAYRKLNVQRTLDESTKNHLKKRSEEAERNFRARKTVVLDPSNPSMKNQMKALAAVDASPWKNFHKNKKEPPFKKRKFESTQVAGPPKVVHKSGFASATSARGRHSTSPLPSPPVQSVSLVSPSVPGNPNKTPAYTGAATPIKATAEENVSKPDKGISGKTFPGVPETTGCRVNESSVPVDLQSMLTSLLKDNSNGMSLKALEKCVGDVLPSSSRKIEPILKKIATYQASGRYILNSEAETGSLKRCSQSGSSPEGNGQQMSVSKELHDDVASKKVVASVEISPDPHLGEQLDLIFGEDPDSVEKNEISQNSPEPLGDKNSQGQAAQSSDSGSDSDSDSDSSDSSDSGSQSRSRSRSPVESGSGSSSDSESDSSSNSKEGSDVDVDIMSEDENEPKHAMQASDQGFPTSSEQWRTPDDRHVENGIVEGMDDQHSEDIDIEGDQDIDIGTTLDLVPTTEAKSTEELRSTFPNQEEHEEQWTADIVGEPGEIVASNLNQEKRDRTHKSKSKSKKATRMKKFEETSDQGKRLIGESYAESSPSRFEEFLFSESPHRPPDKLNEDQYKDINLEVEAKYDRDDNVDSASKRDYGYQGPGQMAVDPPQSGRRPALWPHDSNFQDKSSKNARNDNVHETPVKQKNKLHRGLQDGKGNSNEKTKRNSKESGSKNKHAPQSESYHRKQPDQVKKFHSETNIGLPQQDDSRADAEKCLPLTGRNNMLRRELSGLEQGELREPLSVELDGNNNQFQRQDSFTQFDTNVGTSDSLNVNLNKGKPAGKATIDLRPASPVKGMRNGSSKRSPSVHDDSFENNVIGMEGYGETHKKVQPRRQNDSKQEQASISGKGTKTQKSNPSVKGVSKVKDAFLNDGHNDNRKSESSSDENCSFSKYEKEKPDIKEPVKDLTQYKEYVQEYTEKYSTYCSLNKVLENYRNEFNKMGKELESAKSKDLTKYYRVLRQLRESYQQHGEKHKRLKKIFVVLHEELKHLKQRIKDFAAAYCKD
ncbi:hypothetical protein V2J09_011181 [Rumex salicifolius]